MSLPEVFTGPLGDIDTDEFRESVDGILMELGRTYLEAGKPADARQTFTRLVDEYPESPFSGDAKRELDTLKKTT